jgi:hypothetical protein
MMQSRNRAAAATNKGGCVGKKEVTFEVGVVIERRPATSRWIDWLWRPSAVLEGTPKAEPFTCLSEEPDGTATYYGGTRPVTLWPRETDAYLHNLAAGGSLYVVLRPSGRRDVAFEPQLVTASPYEAEAYTTSSELIMEAVPLPAAVRRTLEAFCEAYPFVDIFEKRKRKPGKRREQQLFGKEPIFKPSGRMPEGGRSD